MNWSAKIINHNGEKRIAVYFEKNKELIERIKRLEGSRWSQKMKVWHLPDTEIYRKQFQITTSEIKLINQEGIDAITKFTFWLRSKRYSEKTIITYCDALKSFLTFYNEKPIQAIKNEDVIVFNNEFIIKKTYQNPIKIR